MSDIKWLLALFMLACCPLTGQAAPAPPPANPITATIHTEDADRFAAMFEAANGKPTAAQIQKGYLDPASYGVEVFTPDRIKDAASLAEAVALNTQDYAVAIAQCLPVAKRATAELRSIYLGLRGLYPKRPLPQIYIVFGRGTSGGTAGPGAQVLGLEVLCKTSPNPEELRQTLRMFFAHETVHTWQPGSTGAELNPLLRSVLQEGAADYIASVVLGASPSAEREAWAPQREAALWQQFEADVASMRDLDWNALQKNKDAKIRFHRWVENYGSPPKDWPFEMGYWIGMRIWQRYVETATDKRAAFEEILTSTDANAVLERGRYRP